MGRQPIGCESNEHEEHGGTQYWERDESTVEWVVSHFTGGSICALSVLTVVICEGANCKALVVKQCQAFGASQTQGPISIITQLAARPATQADSRIQRYRRIDGTVLQTRSPIPHPSSKLVVTGQARVYLADVACVARSLTRDTGAIDWSRAI